MATDFGKCVFHLLVVITRGRPRHFVGRNQMHAVFGDIEITARQFLTRGDIQHHHFVKALNIPQLRQPSLSIVWYGFVVIVSKHFCCIDTLWFEAVSLAVNHRHQFEVHAMTLFQLFFLLSKQLQPAGADVAFPAQSQRDPFLCLEQCVCRPVTSGSTAVWRSTATRLRPDSASHTNSTGAVLSCWKNP